MRTAARVEEAFFKTLHWVIAGLTLLILAVILGHILGNGLGS